MAAETKTVFRGNRLQGNVGINNTAAGFEESLWQVGGNPGGGAVPPTTWTNPGRATGGGVMQSDPAGGGVQKWLTSMMAAIRMSGRLVLYDRLGHMSGFSGTDTTLKNVNGGSAATLSRHYLNAQGNTDDGNEIFFENYVSIGATPQTVTVNYTNSAGGAQTGSATLGGTTINLGQKISRVQLAAGDTGVQSVTSFQLAGSTGTVGNFGIVVAHRILELELSGVASPEVWSGIDGQFKEVLTDACLFFTFLPGGTSVANTPVGFMVLNFADV